MKEIINLYKTCLLHLRRQYEIAKKRIYELEKALDNIDELINHDMEDAEIQAVLKIINKVR